MSGYSAQNPHFNRSDIDVDAADAEEAAERHDAYLRKLARDEYNVAVRFAKNIFDHEVGVAICTLAAGSPEYAAAFDAADKKFTDAITAARTAMPARLATLRANDAAENMSALLDRAETLPWLWKQPAAQEATS